MAASTPTTAPPPSSSPATTAPAKPTTATMLRSRVSIRNHLSGPGSGDEPPVAVKAKTWGKEGLLGFASGLVAGVVGVITGHPFDIVKTRRQVFGANARLLEEGGFQQPPRQILRQLFRGIGPPLITTGIVQTINFGTYDTILRMRRGPNVAPENARLVDYFVAGLCGGVTISFITCPASLVKIQMQTTKAGSNVSYWSIVAGMRSRGLVNGFYRAYLPDVINQSFGRGTYMVSYEAIKRALREMDPATSTTPTTSSSTTTSSSSSSRRPQPLYQRIIAAAIAGVNGWLVIYPVDVVRCRLQADALSPGQNLYAGTMDCFRKTVAQGGYRALFNGLGYTLLRAVPVASVILPTYDYTFYRLSVLWGIEPARDEQR